MNALNYSPLQHTHIQRLAEADALRAALEQQLRDVQALPLRLLAAAFAH